MTRPVAGGQFDLSRCPDVPCGRAVRCCETRLASSGGCHRWRQYSSHRPSPPSPAIKPPSTPPFDNTLNSAPPSPPSPRRIQTNCHPVPPGEDVPEQRRCRKQPLTGGGSGGVVAVVAHANTCRGPRPQRHPRAAGRPPTDRVAHQRRRLCGQGPRRPPRLAVPA